VSDPKGGQVLKATGFSVAPILILMSCVGQSLGQTAHTADRVLAAEGDFVAQTKEGIRPLSHWKLWKLDDGGYEVVDQKHHNADSVEIFEFDSQLMPKGFTKKVGGLPQTQTGQPSRDVTISCQYKTRELTCTADSSGGNKSSTSITAEPPYVFIGEFYDLNYAWFMTGVVNLASRGDAKNGYVNVYILTEGTKLGEIALEADKPIKITFVGQEAGESDDKSQVLKEFEWEGTDSFSILHTNAKSMVVGLSNKRNPAIRLAIINYREYVPWGPSR
jgi:hypothetical protein